jgi:hypothetical protein
MKRGPQNRERKQLSADGLLKRVRRSLERLDDGIIQGRKREIQTSDCAMSAIAMFSLKSPSLLAFDRALKEPTIAHNLKCLYGIKRAPCDTYMREVLDEVSPRELRNIFLSLFESVQKNRLLREYWFSPLDSYLLTIDGTEIFESDKVHCLNCCERRYRSGKVSHYHQVFGGAIVNPDISQVIPLCPEPITKQDGASKNDCERNAAKRFLKDLHSEHPRLKITIVADALHADAQSINRFKMFDYSFIVAVKKGCHKALFDWIEGIELEKVDVTVKKNRYQFRFINNISLNDTKNAPLVNFLECEAFEVSGKKIIRRYFTWVTDHEITQDNVYAIMRGGRAKWKIENETFNTLKNQGYQFEHNFGHGNKNLHSVFAALMMAAFLIDQIQEAACGLFNAALAYVKTRRTLWERLRAFFTIVFVKSWSDLFKAIGKAMGLVLTIDSS